MTLEKQRIKIARGPLNRDSGSGCVSTSMNRYMNSCKQQFSLQFLYGIDHSHLASHFVCLKSVFLSSLYNNYRAIFENFQLVSKFYQKSQPPHFVCSSKCRPRCILDHKRVSQRCEMFSQFTHTSNLVPLLFCDFGQNCLFLVMP